MFCFVLCLFFPLTHSINQYIYSLNPSIHSVNIWTHLIACFAYGFFAYQVFLVTRECTDVIVGDTKWVFVATVFAVTWLFSAIYHTFRCHSEDVYSCTLICDLCGIVATIFCCNYLTVAYELRLYPRQQIYWHVINIASGVLNVALVPVLMHLKLPHVRTVCW